MHPNDLEIGPIEGTFESLFKSIKLYFNSHPVAPDGNVTETSLSNFSQEQLRTTLNTSLKHYGFFDLPYAFRIIVGEETELSGIHRSDSIVTYREEMKDGSHRTFNFYTGHGPEKMKVSFYWLNMKGEGEQIQGILTEDNRWYLRIKTPQSNTYYLRIEKSEPDL